MKNNYVAKNARRFNMSAVHTNRKRALAAGYCKHPNQDESVCEMFLDEVGTNTPDGDKDTPQDVTEARTNEET